MRKVYKINGKTEVHLVLESASGKTKYKIAFTKGNLDPKLLAPATYSTNDPVIQEVIERDKLFNKVIFLDKVYGEIAPAAPSAPAAPAAPAKGKGKGKGETLKEMPEVTTLADAVTVLTAEGASAADFDGSVKGAIKIAKGLGLSFPNLKGE